MNSRTTKVHIKNQDVFSKKLAEFREDGPNSFHVIADFDKTLTYGFDEKGDPHNSFTAIRDGDYLTQEYIKLARALYNHYHTFEVSTTLSVKEKSEKMLEWWSKHWRLMKESGITQQIIDDIVTRNKINLRPETKIFFNLLHEKNIPLLIFSAGVGNVIEGILKRQKLFEYNSHIISNFFKFDSSGKCIGYTADTIHVFNKDERHVKDHTYHAEIENRKNVLLLGDSLGDLSMCNGIKHNTILTIGFFNYDIEEKQVLFDQFLEQYDVVLTGDGDFKYVNKLMESILNHKP